jgi:arylsulfatase A
MVVESKRRRYERGLAWACGLGLAALLPAATWAADGPQRPPNIVFILIDDLGWSDVGCFGSTFYETPHVDRLAREGMRFTNAYAASPLCSPTRASIMTGKHPARLKLTNYLKGLRTDPRSPLLPAEYADQLPLEELTLAEVLQQAGYVTGHVGKWHLGGEGFGPRQQGFDINIGGTSAGSPKSYFWPQWEGRPPVQGTFEGEYLTDRLSQEACRFIREHAQRPFFLYLAHYTVHIPIQPRPDKLEKYQRKLREHPPAPGQQNNPHYAAMVESMDDSVGRVLETLKELGLEDNTVVFFFSDNGGLSVPEGRFTPATTNSPLRAGKGYVYEGGIREPAIVRWPGVTSPGSTCHVPICSVDFLPTICRMAGRDPATLPSADSLDGVDITPLLRDPQARLQRGPLYWHYPHFSNQGGRPSAAIRDGDWKLVEHFEDGRLELFHLREDIGEQHDLAQRMPEKAAELRSALRRWLRGVDAPMPRPNPQYVPASP